MDDAALIAFGNDEEMEVELFSDDDEEEGTRARANVFPSRNAPAAVQTARLRSQYTVW